MKTLKLSVLDQSLAQSSDTAPKALAETLAMAKWCEDLGYERFWVSEHHAFPMAAGSSPEVLLSAIGAATTSIRIGAGGIMLPHYSPYKVAENFSLLANLYENRVDLGVGRAPGADDKTALALAHGRNPQFSQFPAMIDELNDYLNNPDATPKVCPKPPPHLPLWILGSTPASAALAAQRGLPYNLAAFINPTVTADITRYYRDHFTPSTPNQSPYAILTIGVFCAESEADAIRHQQNHDINLFQFFNDHGRSERMSPDETALYPHTPKLAAFIEARAKNSAAGTPEQVAKKIKQLADTFQVDEIMAVTSMYHFDDRKRSFSLLKEAVNQLYQ